MTGDTTDRRQTRTCGSCSGRVDGHCRALSPQVVAMPDGRMISVWPAVDAERPAIHIARHRMGARVLIAGRYGNVEDIASDRYFIRCDDGTAGWVGAAEIEPLPSAPREPVQTGVAA